MNLKRDLWYVRWFLWSADVVAECTNWQGEHRTRCDAQYYLDHPTSLCQFMRVVLVWAPLVLVLHVIAYGLLFMAIVGYPAYRFGTTYWTIVGACALFVGACFGLRYVYARYGYAIGAGFGMAAHSIAVPLARAVERVRAPSFVTLLWQYAVALKQRTCPRLTIVE